MPTLKKQWEIQIVYLYHRLPSWERVTEWNCSLMMGCVQILYTTVQYMEMNVTGELASCPEAGGIDLTDLSIVVGNSSDISYSYWTDVGATRKVDDPKHILKSGTYYINGTSSLGCVVIKPVKVTIGPVPPITFARPPTASYFDGLDLPSSFAHVTGITYSYWADKDTIHRLKNPERIREGGTYFIKADNGKGCSAIFDVSINILPDLVAPNVFTPNGDGVNDLFTIKLNTKTKIKFVKIIDRWGSMVFLTSDISHYWDGFRQGTMLPVGIYFWMVEGVADSRGKFVRTGSVQVIR
jgi:gliding motility-associated-like protein